MACKEVEAFDLFLSKTLGLRPHSARTVVVKPTRKRIRLFNVFCNSLQLLYPHFQYLLLWDSCLIIKMRHSWPAPLATCGGVMQEEQLLSVSARVACSSLSKVRSLCKNLNVFFCRKIKMPSKKNKIKIFSIISSFLLLMRLFPLAFYIPNSLLPPFCSS